jgi:hypothetical protein
LLTLIPAGEFFYDHNEDRGYQGFCDSDVVENLSSRIDSAVICHAEKYEWAACAGEFETPERAFCVDSRGYKRQICKTTCDNLPLSCPEEDLNNCKH